MTVFCLHHHVFTQIIITYNQTYVDFIVKNYDLKLNLTSIETKVKANKMVDEETLKSK